MMARQKNKIENFLGSNEPRIVLIIASLLPFGLLAALVWVIFLHYSIHGDIWRTRGCYQDASCRSVIKSHGAPTGYMDRLQISDGGSRGMGSFISTFTYCPSLETQRASPERRSEELAGIAMELKERGLISKMEPFLVTAKCRYTKGHPIIEALFGAPMEQIFGQIYYGAEKIPGEPKKRDFDILQIDPT
ncbi:MAG: hypothetical protein HY547_03460 [Elusimicrobia bacterium]|nr:hypothetical protein [Elusimicrobiota bacterium]